MSFWWIENNLNREAKKASSCDNCGDVKFAQNLNRAFNKKIHPEKSVSEVFSCIFSPLHHLEDKPGLNSHLHAIFIESSSKARINKKSLSQMRSEEDLLNHHRTSASLGSRFAFKTRASQTILINHPSMSNEFVQTSRRVGKQSRSAIASQAEPAGQNGNRCGLLCD